MLRPFSLTMSSIAGRTILPKKVGTMWAALAAAAEINQRVFEEEGGPCPDQPDLGERPGVCEYE